MTSKVKLIQSCFWTCEVMFIKKSSSTLLARLTSFGAPFSTSSVGVSKYTELPEKLKRSERKPLLTHINELKRRARLEKQIRKEVHEITLHPPENGLLVKRLVPIAHQVYAARNELYSCVSRVLDTISIHVCGLCGEVHVGLVPHKIRTCYGSKSKDHKWESGNIENILPIVESFHLYDRLGRAVSHEEQLKVDRIPAIVELCIQAGVDIPEYPTRRRTFPVYNISGRMIDFERRFPLGELVGNDIETFGFWERREKCMDHIPPTLASDDLQGIAVQGMEAWQKMRAGALKLMEKYAVKTCGYCPEVQVGPKGHRVRICRTFKHQMRDGQHAWQDASLDDLIPPVYVWHVPEPQRASPMLDKLKRFYGKLPAVVELFSQAGAMVGDEYMGLMRIDVSVPKLEEVNLVA